MIRRFSFVLALAILGSIALVPSVAAGGGCYAPESVKLSTGEADGLIAECAFQPTVNYIEPGEKVTWTNKDVFDHTVTGAASSWGSDASISQGETVSYTFEDEGVYPYYCAYHPSMVGAVVVGDGTSDGSSNAGAAVLPADDPPTSTEAAATGSSQSTTFIALAVGALALVAALMTWRAWKLRRRHVPAAPSL
jgi:plastocyanin